MEILPALVERLRAATDSLPEPHSTLTIGDVFLELIPYRTVRDQLGVLEFAAYEHALLRLFGGEGGHVRVRDTHALEEIRRELESVHPILGIYRDYADAPIEIVNGSGQGSRPVPPLRAEADREAGQPPASTGAALARPHVSKASSAEEVSGGDPVAPAPGADESPSTESRPSLAPPATEASPSPTPRQSEGCRRCGRSLPPLEDLRFCPYCGTEHGPADCGQCGAVLNSEWSFCIRCGAARPE